MDTDIVMTKREDENYRDVPMFQVKAKKDNVFTVTASTPEVDRDGEIILPSAFKRALPEFLAKNPVILWMHDMWSPPVAKAVDGRIGETFELDIVFGSTPFAQEIKTLVEEGIINTVSVGMIYKDWDFDAEGRKVITDLELWETSIVTIPSNRGALIQRAKSAGLSIPLYEQKTLTESNPKSKPELQAGRLKTMEEKRAVTSAKIESKGKILCGKKRSVC